MNPLQHDHTQSGFVEVRRKDEIFATLDENGMLEGISFMPEMLQYCGKTFRVARHANITCVELHGVRRMPNAVLLEGIRCDGSCHDGCQKLCPVMWKSAWLKTPGHGKTASVTTSSPGHSPKLVTREGDRYRCQATELLGTAAPIRWWDPRLYAHNLLTGRQSVPDMFRDLSNSFQIRLTTARTGERAMPWGGHRTQTPRSALHLKPGELVEIRPFEEIRSTLDSKGRNRGLEFTPEMRPFCGLRFKVRDRVERVIFDTTGRMHTLTDTVMLEGAQCDGGFHRGCSRNLIFHWREIWLNRVEAPAADIRTVMLNHSANEALEDEAETADVAQDPYLAKIEKLLTVQMGKTPTTTHGIRARS
jgi:hypothetical protein